MPLSLFHLHGELKDLPFPRLLAGLRSDRFTGVLQALTRETGGGSVAPRAPEAETTREVHFADGHIAWAISTDPEESLKSYLLRHGAVTERQWAAAEAQAAGSTLRQALAETGAITQRELTQKEKGRIEEIVLALFPARDGEYRVRERQLPPGTPDLAVDPNPVLLRGMMASADYALVMEEVGSLDSVPVLSGGPRSEPDPALPGEFQAILKHIDGRNSVGDLCALTGLPDNYVCTLVAALNMVGAVKRLPAGRPRNEERAPETRAAAAPPPAAAPRSAPPPAIQPLLHLEPEKPIAPPAAPRPLPAPAPLLALPEPEEESADEAMPPIETGPFVTEDSEADATADDPAFGPPEEEAIPSPPIPESQAPPASIYAAGAEDHSRPWFLLGGAAAVAFAALFMILMSQGGGTAEEIAPGSAVAASPAAEEPEAEEADSPEDPDGGYGSRSTLDSPAEPPAARPVSRVASSAPAPILTDGPRGDPGGRQRLASGDIAGAARSFRRETASASGEFTIQLLAACKEETVERAVRSAGGSPRIFVLPAKVSGQDCYRVLWGRYASSRMAEEALRSDVPRIFRQDRNKPRVTRLPG